MCSPEGICWSRAHLKAFGHIETTFENQLHGRCTQLINVSSGAAPIVAELCVRKWTGQLSAGWPHHGQLVHSLTTIETASGRFTAGCSTAPVARQHQQHHVARPHGTAAAAGAASRGKVARQGRRARQQQHHVARPLAVLQRTAAAPRGKAAGPRDGA